LLGIDSKFISRFVLVAQNEIFAFIEDGASEVDKFFQKLFGTAFAEKCHDTINKQLNKLVIPEVPDPVTVLEAQNNELEIKINELSEEVNKLPTISVFMEAQTGQQKILQDWQARTKFAEHLASTEAAIAECGEQLSAVDAACSSYYGNLASISQELAEAQEAGDKAKAALDNLIVYRQLAEAKLAADKRLNQISALRNSRNEPPALSDDEFNELVNTIATLELRLNERQKFVTTFDSDSVAACPTCGTAASNLKPAVDDAKTEIIALAECVSDGKQKIAAATAGKEARLAWEKEEAKLSAEAAQLRDSVSTLDNFQAPAADEPELLKVITEYEKLKAAKTELDKLAQKEKEKKANILGRLDNLKQQKDELSEKISAIAVTQADATLAQSTLDVLSRQCVQRQTLEKQLTQLEFERTSLVEKIAATRDTEFQAATLREWSATATAAKDALKIAPRIVAKRNLQRLEIAVNELLQIFNVDFFVRAATDDSPTFVAEFLDGRKQPAKRLSYGQKTVLALAFRVAVNALFAEQIGLLALDEPTAYLDQQRIKALAPVLERLRELSTARGLQCLLVTHETSLAHLFESAVELDA